LAKNKSGVLEGDNARQVRQQLRGGNSFIPRKVSQVAEKERQFTARLANCFNSPKYLL